MLDSARSAAKTPNITPKHATNSPEIAIFARMLDLGAAQTFSNEFSGMSRARQKLHMACGIAHTQPQPKLIGVTRIIAKKTKQQLQIILVHQVRFVFPKVL